MGCPIRRSSDHRVLPPSRSFAQGATSFIASRCQGIHQMPFSFARELSSDPHAPAHRCQKTENRCQIVAISSCPALIWCAQCHGNPLMRTHTRSSVQGSGDRNQETGNSALPEHPAPEARPGTEDPLTDRQSNRVLARRRRPAHRRLPKPSSRFQEQETEDRTREPGTRFQDSASGQRLQNNQNQ